MRQAEPPGYFSRAALLFDLLVGVVQRYEPEVAAVLREERTTAGMSAVKLARTLQAQGIWFQLLAIVEQNRDMRSRREIERERGYEQLRGTFANVFAAAAADGIAERFPQFRRRLARRLKTNAVSREQVQLLRAHRTASNDAVRTALLMSIDCAAAGLGATG